MSLSTRWFCLLAGLAPFLVSCSIVPPVVKPPVANPPDETGVSLPASKYAPVFRKHVIDQFKLDTGLPDLSFEVVPVADQRFTRALRVGKDEGYAELACVPPDSAAIPAGSRLLGRVAVRTAEPANENGDGFGAVYLFRSGGDLPFAQADFIVDGEWRNIYFPFEVGEAIPAGSLRVAISPGVDAQVLEFADFQLFNFGSKQELYDLPYVSMGYPGRSSKAAWREAANRRIDELRKGDLTITVVDPRGRLVQGADVALTMRKHHFDFGTAINKRMLQGGTSRDDKMYHEVLKALFNKATFENGMKWNQWDNPDAPFLREQTLKAYQWLLANQFEVKGHVLVWPAWNRQNPPGLKDLEPEALRRKVDAHISEMVGHFMGQIEEWDVVNEARSSRDFLDVLGDAVMVDWYRLAHRADPGAQLYHNEFGILSGPESNVDDLLATLDSLLKAKAPVGGIGLQGHFKSRLPAPEEMLDRLDRLSVLGLPVQITEFDVATRDRLCQADFTRDFYTAMFSHPAVQGITCWGFWEGEHWQPEAAMFQKDWIIKPNGSAFVDLLYKDWWTKASGYTDNKGSFTARGFLGDYEVLVRKGPVESRKRVSIIREGRTVKVVLGGNNPDELGRSRPVPVAAVGRKPASDVVKIDPKDPDPDPDPEPGPDVVNVPKPEPEPKPEPKPEPAPKVVDVPKPEPKPEPKPAPKVVDVPEPKPEPKPEPEPEPKPKVVQLPKPEPKPEPKSDPDPGVVKVDPSVAVPPFSTDVNPKIPPEVKPAPRIPDPGVAVVPKPKTLPRPPRPRAPVPPDPDKIKPPAITVPPDGDPTREPVIRSLTGRKPPEDRKLPPITRPDPPAASTNDVENVEAPSGLKAIRPRIPKGVPPPETPRIAVPPENPGLTAEEKAKARALRDTVLKRLLEKRLERQNTPPAPEGTPEAGGTAVPPRKTSESGPAADRR